MTTDPVLVADASVALTALSVWVDAGNAHRNPEAITWGRLSKITEEAGEVIAAWIGVTGQNTRKGRTHTVRDVEAELYDVAVTALTAVAHLRSNRPGGHVMDDLCRKLVAVADRAGCLPADDTYGPQTAAIKALIARAAVLTPDEAERLQNARGLGRDAARHAVWDATWRAERLIIRGAARGALWDANQVEIRGRAIDAAQDAVCALIVRNVLLATAPGRRAYATATGPWAAAVGPAHPGDVTG